MSNAKRKESTTKPCWNIKKHSSLVQMNHFGTLIERKVMNALIWIARDELKRNPNERMFRSDLGLVKHLTGYKDGNNDSLKVALKNLRNNPIEYNIFNKDQKEWGVFSFLAAVKIVEEGRGKPTWIHFEFPTTIREVVKHPEIYVTLNLFVSRNLGCKHSVALYEFLIDYLKIGRFSCTIEDFRKLMGIPEGKYSNFSMLKKRTIEKAVKIVNEKTEINISYELEKIGRKVSAIHFKMTFKKNNITQIAHQWNIKAKLTKFGIEDWQINELLKLHDEKYLQANIKIVEEDFKRRGNKIRNIKAYLLKWFKVDYRPTERMQKNRSSKRRKDEKETGQKLYEHREKEARLFKQFEQQLNQKIELRMNILQEDEISSLEEEFRLVMANNPAFSKRIKWKALSHPLIEGQRKKFLAKKFLSQKEYHFEYFKQHINGTLI